MKEKPENPSAARIHVGDLMDGKDAFGLSVLASLLIANSVVNAWVKDVNHEVYVFWATFLFTNALFAGLLFWLYGRQDRLIRLLEISRKHIRYSSDYLHGRGVIKSLQIAENHYKRAISGFSVVANASTSAETCFACAMALDSLAKEHGLTVYPDTKFADMRFVAMAYLRAALLGSSAAQLKVALHYQDGIGFSTDFCEAYAWFNIAAAGGSVEAERSREFIATRLSAGDLARAQQRSLELLAMVNGKG